MMMEWIGRWEAIVIYYIAYLHHHELVKRTKPQDLADSLLSLTFPKF
jgi:hypothetical protein